MGWVGGPVGAAATRAGHAKKSKHASSFGPRAKDLERARQRALRKSLHDRVQHVFGNVASMAALQEIEQVSGGVDDVVRVTRRCLHSDGI